MLVECEGEGRCQTNRTAGVICRAGNTLTVFHSSCVSDQFINTCLTPGFECNDSDIRLVNGSNMREGVVEICFDGVWGTVCASGLDNVVASVICRRLGFSDAGTYIPVVPNLPKYT